MDAAPKGPQRQIVKVWENAWRQLDKDLQGWAARLADGQPPLKVGEQRRLQTTINAVMSYRRMNPYNAQIVAGSWDAMAAAAAKSAAIASPQVEKWASEAAKKASGQITGSLDLVNQPAVKAAVKGTTGAMTSDIGKMSKTAQYRMANDLVTAVAVGDSPADLAKRIKKSIEPQFGTAQARSLMIARTQLARAYDLGRHEVYMNAAQRGLIYGWEWRANGPNVCPICSDLNGTIWPPGEDTYRHPNCACNTVPIIMADPKAQQPYGLPNDSDLTRVTSTSGWTHWQKTGKTYKGPVQNKPVTSKPPTKTLPGHQGSGEAFVNGDYGMYDGDPFKWDGKQWIHVPTSTPAGPNSAKALSKAAPDKKPGGKPEAVAQGALGEAKVYQNSGTFSATYDGHKFALHQDGYWLHVKSGSKAGPKSHAVLDKAFDNGGFKKPAPPKTPKAPAYTPPTPKGDPSWVLKGQLTDATDLEKVKAGSWKGNNPDRSPISGVSPADWRLAWDRVSDGYRLPDSIYTASGWKTLWNQFNKYSSDYTKRWVKDYDRNNVPISAIGKRMREAFDYAPTYASTAWRGIRVPGDLGEWLSANGPGATLDLRGGSSFSFKRGTAQSFGGWGSSSKSVLIEVREGVSGYPIRGFSNHGHEDEILVGSKLEVVSVTRTVDGIHIVAREVGKFYGN